MAKHSADGAPSDNPAADQAGVQAAVEAYFNGTYLADRRLMERAFHPTAVIEGYFEGRLLSEPRDAFIGRIAAEGSAELRSEPFDKRIIQLTAHGKLAAVIAEVAVGERMFRDVMSLLKENDLWTIRHKLYEQLPSRK